MNAAKLRMWGCAVCFAALMSIPFLIPGTGVCALFGFVPLLWMDRLAEGAGIRRLWRWHFPAFVLWNAATTFWVCHATVGGGIFAIVANALQMSLVFGLFRLSKRHFTGALPYLFLALLWITWERWYFGTQISWPWLTLGHAFARTLPLIQWYEYTGTLGGSLWVWVCNLSLFGLTCGFRGQAAARRRAAAWVGTVLVFLVPPALSLARWFTYRETDDPLEVAVFQPDFDPYHKFQKLTQEEQNAVLTGQMQRCLKDRRGADPSSLQAPLLALAPETFTRDVVVGHVPEGKTFRRMVSFLQDYPGVNLLFGTNSREYILQADRPSQTARDIEEGVWMETHNSAVMTDASGRWELFHKNKLVVGTELMPYPGFFRPIDDWLGGVMGRDVGQDTVSVLHVQVRDTAGVVATDIPVGCAICYESVYGDYCREYILKGARLLAVITNDAWWGDTPGYRQHLSYASLRAIETRRDIARCANTGISALIDQRGRIRVATPWWERAELRGRVNLNDRETFFVRNGDIVGRFSSFLCLLLALALAARRIISHRGRRRTRPE